MKKTVFYVLLFCLLFSSKASAMSIEEYDFEELDEFLKGEESTEYLSFSTLLEEIMTTGNVALSEGFREKINSALFGEFARNKKILLLIMCIAFGSAMFTHFSQAFDNGQLSKTTLLIVRLINVSVLITAFGNIMPVISDFMEMLLEWMHVLLPVYMFSVTFSTGTFTAVALKESAMLVTTLVESCVLAILLPMIRLYVIISLVNSVAGTDNFKKMCQLIKTLIVWGNNTLLAVVAGMSFIKKMIAPYADQAGNIMLTKVVSFIPGIGSGVSGISEMVFGTARFIRNSIGAVGLVIVVVICCIPLVKMMVFSLIYKLCGALLEPVADAKIVEGISCVGEGVTLLIRICVTGALMFMLTIGMICM